MPNPNVDKPGLLIARAGIYVLMAVSILLVLEADSDKELFHAVVFYVISVSLWFAFCLVCFIAVRAYRHLHGTGEEKDND